VTGGSLFCRSWDGELAAFDLTTLVPPVVEPPVVVTEALLAQLQAPPLAEREAAIARLARVADADLPALVTALTERLRGTWTAQASAGEVLRRLGTRARAAAPALVATAQAALAAHDESLASLAVATLAAVDPAASDQVVPALVAALADSDLAHRRQALRVVQHLGVAPAPEVDAVLGLFGDADPALTNLAIITAGYLDAAAARVVPALVARLPRRGEWPLLFQSLESLGPAAREAIPELVKLQVGTDAKTAETIAGVIERIRTGAP
jgi:hypothetical protein